jgi:hypothetical protein
MIPDRLWAPSRSPKLDPTETSRNLTEEDRALAKRADSDAKVELGTGRPLKLMSLKFGSLNAIEFGITS